MNAAVSVERDAGVFVDMVARCFEVSGGVAPELTPASLEWSMPEPLDTTGYMAVSGNLHGWIALSLSDELAIALLEVMGETQHDETALLDLTAELTGVITSNAREHFGARMQVLPPQSTRTRSLPPGFEAPPIFFKLPFNWRGDEAFLLVAFYS